MIKILIILLIAVQSSYCSEIFTVEILNQSNYNGKDHINKATLSIVDGKTKYPFQLQIRNQKVEIAILGQLPYTVINLNYDKTVVLDELYQENAGNYYLFVRKDGKITGFRIFENSETRLLKEEELIVLKKTFYFLEQ